MKTSAIVLALTLLSTGSGQSFARNPVPARRSTPVPTTAGCLLVSNLVANRATNPKDRDLAESSLDFFLGRIGESTTSQQLKFALQKQGHAISKGNAVPLMNACLREMQIKSQILQSAARQLEQGK